MSFSWKAINTLGGHAWDRDKHGLIDEVVQSHVILSDVPPTTSRQRSSQKLCAPPRPMAASSVVTVGLRVRASLLPRVYTALACRVNKHCRLVLPDSGQNVSALVHNIFFRVWFPLTGGTTHAISPFLDGISEHVTWRLSIPLLRDTWVVRDTGAVPNATALDVLGHASHCTCEMHFCWGYTRRAAAGPRASEPSVLLDNAKLLPTRGQHTRPPALCPSSGHTPPSTVGALWSHSGSGP